MLKAIDSPRGAFIAMLVGAALISTTSIFVRYAHVAPTVSAFYRMAFGGVMLLLGLLAFGRWRRLQLRDLIWLLLPALLFAFDLFIWHRSIHDIGPGLATLLGNFQVFVMALAGVWFFHERLGWRFLAGLGLALLGLWLLVGLDWSHASGDYRRGVMLGIVTGIAYAGYMLATRYVQNGRVVLDSAQQLCVTSLLCALILALTIVVEGASFSIPDAQSLSALLGLGLVGQVLGWLLLVRAIPQLPPSLVGLLLLLQPSLSFVLDVLLFQRPTVVFDWIGVTLSLLGIFIGTARKARVEVASSATVE
jgi:drug/metabolite transporter (DMT)-like permease